MTNKLVVNSAGLRLVFTGDCEIKRSARFSAFEETDGAQPEKTVYITLVRKEPTIPDRAPDFVRSTHRYYAQPIGLDCFSYYYDTLSGTEKCFAECRKTSPDEYTLYLSPDADCRDGVLLDAFPYAEVMLAHGFPVLHASFINIGNEAVLFTGKSGAGKTTQALLWEKYRSAVIINGDRAAPGIYDGKPFVRAVPYCGSSKTALNTFLPLKAVVFPVHAPVCRARLLTKGEGARRLAGNFTYLEQRRESSDALWSIIGQLAENTRFIELECTPDEGAVNALEVLL